MTHTDVNLSVIFCHLILQTGSSTIEEIANFTAVVAYNNIPIRDLWLWVGM